MWSLKSFEAYKQSLEMQSRTIMEEKMSEKSVNDPNYLRWDKSSKSTSHRHSRKSFNSRKPRDNVSNTRALLLIIESTTQRPNTIEQKLHSSLPRNMENPSVRNQGTAQLLIIESSHKTSNNQIRGRATSQNGDRTPKTTCHYIGHKTKLRIMAWITIPKILISHYPTLPPDQASSN